MFLADRFRFPARDYTYSAKVNFAECGEKVEVDPNAEIAVNFMREEQPKQKQPVKSAESPYTLTQSTQQDSAKPTLSPRETGEIALDDTPAVTMLDSAENSEIQHESKESVSNFAKAKLF